MLLNIDFYLIPSDFSIAVNEKLVIKLDAVFAIMQIYTLTKLLERKSLQQCEINYQSLSRFNMGVISEGHPK